MLTLIPLLIDEPQLSRQLRDALMVSRLAASPALSARARRRAAEILGGAFGLLPDELVDLLGTLDFVPAG